MKGLHFDRQPKGYGMLGLSWAFSDFGKTFILCLGRGQLRAHIRDREMETIFKAAAADMPEKLAPRVDQPLSDSEDGS